jgi:hypothetical protein
LRQAYDYWQDQPGNYLREVQSRGLNPQDFHQPKLITRLQVCYI